MGAAQTQRGNNAIRNHFDAEGTPNEFYVMDALNKIIKYPDAPKPFGDIKFAKDGRNWWTLDTKKGWDGFGYCYPSLREAVKSWDVTIVGYVNGEWIATPN